MKTGQLIKNVAAQKGYNGTTLSNKIFVSRDAIYKWFAGVNIPRIDDFISLSDVLEVKIDDLIVCDDI